MILGKQLNIRATGSCNATCSFCGYNKVRLAEAYARGYKPHRLDVDKLIADLPRLKDYGFKVLHFTGGEPFMEARFVELVTHARNAGFQVRTGTNGSLLREETVRKLADCGLDYLWYSLDTFPFDAHLEHRGFSQIRARMEQGIELLHRFGINFFGQTVISKVIPWREGLPDLEGLMRYYKDTYHFNRFVFSYPMHRLQESDASSHLATEGSEAVHFEREELIAIFRHLLRLKDAFSYATIVNPRLSIFQQIDELEERKTIGGCQAGRSIFFLGADQDSLRPCYYFSDKIVGGLDAAASSGLPSYSECRECRDQCFRDPSILYSLQEKPVRFLAGLVKAHRAGPSIRDFWDVMKTRSYRHA